MLNLSNVMFRIKMKLGIVNLALPFDDINKLLLNIIQEITVPTYSLYLPDRQKCAVVANDAFEVLSTRAEYTEYLLPQFERPLLYINDVDYDDNTVTNLGYYAGTIPIGFSQDSFIGQIMMNNLSANLLNQAIPKLTFDFIEPRTLRIYNAYWSSVFNIDWSFEHSKSLNTIPNDALNSFMELALLDVKENLYPTLSQYAEQNTQYGTIRLPLDSWSSAESDRKALLSEWDDRYHLDGIPFWYG